MTHHALAADETDLTEAQDAALAAAERAALLAVALRQPTLREQVAVVLDATAALGTPEVVFRRNHGESEADAARRLRDEVLERADAVIELLGDRLRRPWRTGAAQRGVPAAGVDVDALRDKIAARLDQVQAQR